MKRILVKSGYGIWVSLFAYISMTIYTTLFCILTPPRTSFHGGATEFSMIVGTILAGFIVLPVCLYDLINKRWWSIVGVILLCAIPPTCWSLMNYFFLLKHFQNDL